MQIEHLNDHRNLIETLARWAHATWGHWYPSSTVEAYAAMFEQRTVPGELPETFVGIEAGRAVGMASLVAKDLPSRPDLSPWLAAVYVVPESRGRGFGSQLVEVVMAEAEALGYDRLHLFTPDKVAFYSRLGWQRRDETVHCGTDVTVMSYTIGTR